MAELLLKVGPSARLDEGDVIEAFNSRRIRCCHAETICHVQHAGFTGEGLRPSGGPAERFQALTRQYKNQRVSPTQYVREEIGTPNTDVIVQPDLDAWLARRREHPRHRIFGTYGSEVWYGGRTKFDNATMDAVWTMIQTQTAETETGWRLLWPFGRLDIRHFLAVRVQDFTDEQLTSFMEPQYQRGRGQKWVWERDSVVGNPTVQETTESVDEPPQDRTRPWRKRVVKEKKYRVEWVTDVLPVISETEPRVRDHGVAIGRDVDMGGGRWRHESKDHVPLTAAVLRNKDTG